LDMQKNDFHFLMDHQKAVHKGTFLGSKTVGRITLPSDLRLEFSWICLEIQYLDLEMDLDESLFEGNIRSQTL